MLFQLTIHRTAAMALRMAAVAALALSSVAAQAADSQTELAAAVRAAAADAAPLALRIETFGGLEKVDDVLLGSGPTTGLAVDADGYLLCSAFSLAQQPTSILVTLPSGKRVAAHVVARDHARMLVLLKVNSDEKLPVPVAVPRREMRVGQTAVALGRTFDVDQPNLSVGIVSAVNRIWGRAIQTDAKISPANYGGPLIDLQGRVLGVLTPMSPQGDGELAGAEWYDSGIGFAVPLADVLERLPQMKQGHDLHAGKLGVSLASADDYAEKIEIAAVLPGSPAAKAGFRKGDRIVGLDGKTLSLQTHLKHELGARYAGDTVAIALARGKERIETIVELVADVPPFDVPFLGVLPMRDFDAAGVKIRYVYPESPAAQAGLQAGDVIRTWAGQPVADAAALRAQLGGGDATVGSRVKLQYDRKGKSTE
ncbi:MAG: PDZ domain-containing protein, partial [Planctomycetales bacterium]|nr:PDZ domain-containing protein [Planctomycetales bacterium]